MSVLIELPSHEQLRELLSYDPETGRFQWRTTARGRKLSRDAGTIRAGYLDICIHGTNYGAHRLAWKLVHGRDPVGQIDHINGDRQDNRLCNLRDATATQQRRNSARPRTNTTGRVGVYFRRDRKKWKAQIGLGNKTVNLGHFATKDEAIAARSAAERELGFHPNHGRSLG